MTTVRVRPQQSKPKSIPFFPLKPPPASLLGEKLWDCFGRHPWDFLQAPAPLPGEKTQWMTVKEYPLGPRLLWQRWQDPEQLIGVRFTHETLYALLDIDVGSPYCNSEAIAQIQAALETIGITRTLLLRSSHSNGLHLYIPLVEPVKTFDLAVALYECLKAQGFAIAKGQLEIFPNVKTYGVERIILYNGHRLPLQPRTGSCLLGDNLNPMGDSLEQFLGLWDGAAAHQDRDALRHALKIGRDNHRQRPRRSRSPMSKVEVWRQDLESDMQTGWTGHHQTNHLLKVIACHGHVFLELEGEDLIAHALNTAIHLPGYREYCRHQHDIRLRVRAWCKAVQHYYWPLSSDSKRDKQTKVPPTLNLNDQRAEEARQRIRGAMQILREREVLPAAIKQRAEAIAREAHISSKTLYRSENLELWHPEHCLDDSAPEEVCKPKEPIGVSASREKAEGEKMRSLKQRNNPEVYTSERSMKCDPLDGPLPQTKYSSRGVRGELSRFPQPTSPESVIYLKHYQPLPPLHPLASREEQARHGNQEALRQCVFQLQWTYPQLSQYIAEQFEGKRFYQLTLKEITMLVYRLRVLLMSLLPQEGALHEYAIGCKSSDALMNSYNFELLRH